MRAKPVSHSSLAIKVTPSVRREEYLDYMTFQANERPAFWGGIDKHVIRRTREEIKAELEYKIPPTVRTGGCVLGLDHRIPNGTPLENYRIYIRKAWQIMDRVSA